MCSKTAAIWKKMSLTKEEGWLKNESVLISRQIIGVAESTKWGKRKKKLSFSLDIFKQYLKIYIVIFFKSQSKSN